MRVVLSPCRPVRGAQTTPVHIIPRNILGADATPQRNVPLQASRSKDIVKLGECSRKRSIVPAVLACLFFWTGALSAQQAVTIKLKPRNEGDTVLVANEEKTSVAMKVIDGTGKVLVNNDETQTLSEEYLGLCDGIADFRPDTFQRDWFRSNQVHFVSRWCRPVDFVSR